MIWGRSLKWEMEFNVKKSHVMEMGKSGGRLNWTYKVGDGEIIKVHEERDMLVTIQDNLQPKSH